MKTSNIFRYFFLTALLLNSCISNDELKLKELLDSSFSRQLYEDDIIVISEYDCIECLKVLQLKLNSQKRDKKIFGIFYHVKPYYNKDFSDFMRQTPINWVTTQNENVIHLIAKISQKGYGPYTIKVLDNQIINID